MTYTGEAELWDFHPEHDDYKEPGFLSWLWAWITRTKCGVPSGTGVPCQETRFHSGPHGALVDTGHFPLSIWWLDEDIPGEGEVAVRIGHHIVSRPKDD